MKIKHVVGGLAIAFGIGPGCGSAGSSPVGVSPESQAVPGAGSTQPPSGTTTKDPAEVEASIQQSLQQLRELQIFGVGQLVLNLPAEATACYSLPCSGSEWVAPYQAERARQAPRLAALAAAAAQANVATALVPRPMSEAAESIQSLRDFQIVEISGLIESAPKNNPQCYNLPCQSDIQAARQENELRAAKAIEVEAIAYRTELQ